uniref:Uncharacterized protein n=1 Tax=Strigamia maritima TaxID=126957 RepID=T1JHP2_STRMM
MSKLLSHGAIRRDFVSKARLDRSAPEAESRQQSRAFASLACMKMKKRLVSALPRDGTGILLYYYIILLLYYYIIIILLLYYYYIIIYYYSP